MNGHRHLLRGRGASASDGGSAEALTVVYVSDPRTVWTNIAQAVHISIWSPILSTGLNLSGRTEHRMRQPQALERRLWG